MSDGIIKIAYQHFLKACDILKANAVERDERTVGEIISVMYVVVDYAVASAEGDRQAASDDFLKWAVITVGNDEWDDVYMDERMDFYGEVVRGRPLRADCLFGSDFDTIRKLHPVLRCAIAFTDCMMNPTYIYDYDGSPVIIRDFMITISLSEKMMKPLGDMLASLFKSIYALSNGEKTRTEKEPAPSNVDGKKIHNEQHGGMNDNVKSVFVALVKLLLSLLVFILYTLLTRSMALGAIPAVILAACLYSILSAIWRMFPGIPTLAEQSRRSMCKCSESTNKTFVYNNNIYDKEKYQRLIESKWYGTKYKKLKKRADALNTLTEKEESNPFHIIEKQQILKYMDEVDNPNHVQSKKEDSIESSTSDEDLQPNLSDQAECPDAEGHAAIPEVAESRSDDVKNVSRERRIFVRPAFFLFVAVIAGFIIGKGYMGLQNKGAYTSFDEAYDAGYQLGFHNAEVASRLTEHTLPAPAAEVGASPVLTKTTPVPNNETIGRISASSLNLRERPSKDSRILQECVKHTRVTILDQEGEWYKVRIGYLEGYMLAEYIEGSNYSFDVKDFAEWRQYGKERGYFD